MKRCPSCSQTYSDDSQVFCSNDGARLESSETSSSYDPQATILAPPPAATTPSMSPPSFNDPQPPSYGSSNQPSSYGSGSQQSPPSYGSNAATPSYGSTPGSYGSSTPAQSDYTPTAWSPPAAQVAQPYQGGQFMQGADGKIQNYLVPAILSTIFCCLPIGVVSIIFATQVNSKVASGDIQGAMNASKNAKLWMFISIGAGFVFTLCVILIQILGAAVR